ncbi:uncharacterized protein BYT42DRAFT_500023 [Radiomyces spectabilis]|uniref:uncharacterized protein n=1 Tax=Radiomyces spectabilis TaxID=64574 RepID=UPI0022202814|nr:uncharacterized protein BYT42DRAFT_500023 [Radiomyces spectabilis]KAI8374233.1 hypothetical protein BYT42DRAFT_500023 [Radiomyces spectabilis]
MGIPSPNSHAELANTLFKEAQELMAKKDDIESQLKDLQEGLNMQGVGMDVPLVDRSGFPRSDVDVAAARTSRNLVYRLRNDYKAIMHEIELKLHAIHQAKRDAPERLTTQGVVLAEEIPFAKVNGVAPDSPADTAGLRRGDSIVRFGHVHAHNSEGLQALNQLVRQSEGAPIEVVVLRSDAQRVSLTLTPQSGWGGRGTLGCHIVPIA